MATRLRVQDYEHADHGSPSTPDGGLDAGGGPPASDLLRCNTNDFAKAVCAWEEEEAEVMVLGDFHHIGFDLVRDPLDPATAMWRVSNRSCAICGRSICMHLSLDEGADPAALATILAGRQRPINDAADAVIGAYAATFYGDYFYERA
jgi:hypothetical protein